MLSELMICFMYLRIYFVLRNIGVNSIFMSPFAKMLCRTESCEADWKFFIKCQIELNTEWTIFWITMVTILVPAHILKILECPFSKQETDPGLKDAFDSFFNSIWCVVITLTTVGYGDLYPSTYPGRTVLMLYALWGGFVMALLTVMLFKIIDLPVNEKIAMYKIN